MAKSKFKLKPETIDLIGELLIKIVGDTVRDKFIRAVLIAGIAGGIQLISNEPPEAPTVPHTNSVFVTK